MPDDKPTKVATYCRVSSGLQADAHGIDAQAHAIDAWLLANGVQLSRVARFQDLAVSGATMNRKGWNALMAAIRAGEVRTVVMYDLTRAGRTLKGLIEWMEEMQARKVRVVFVKDAIDVGTAMGELVVKIMGAVAEFARKETARRASDGIKARIAKGEKWGGARVVDPTRHGCAKVTPEAWENACQRRRKGELISSIAADLGIGENYLSLRFRKAGVYPAS